MISPTVVSCVAPMQLRGCFPHQLTAFNQHSIVWTSLSLPATMLHPDLVLPFILFAFPKSVTALFGANHPDILRTSVSPCFDICVTSELRVAIARANPFAWLQEWDPFAHHRRWLHSDCVSNNQSIRQPNRAGALLARPHCQLWLVAHLEKRLSF